MIFHSNGSDLNDNQAKVFLLGLFIVLGLVGSIDAQDEQDAFKHYEEMVCRGDVPDYKELNPEC